SPRTGRGGPGHDLPGDDRDDGRQGLLDLARRQDAARDAVRRHPARNPGQGGGDPLPEDGARQIRPDGPGRGGLTMPDRPSPFKSRPTPSVGRVRLGDGREYAPACTLAVYEQVAWHVHERAAAGVSTGELWKALPALPYTQINVALAFLAERG